MPADLHVSSPVVDVDVYNSTIVLENGTVVKGDLILGADGVRVSCTSEHLHQTHLWVLFDNTLPLLQSVTRKSVVGAGIKPFGSGKSAFRFLIPRQRILEDPVTARLAERDGYMTLWIGDDRRLVMYPCSNNALMNFVAIHPSILSSAKEDDWSREASKSTLLGVYSDFGPTVRSLLEMADEGNLKVWTLLDMERIPRWVNGRVALLGDAAHPFLPRKFYHPFVLLSD